MSEIARVTKPMDDFQAQVISRLRDDIRDLLPEAALAELVKRAVDETFFQERKTDRGYGSYTTRPSWFVEEVTRAAQPMLERAVRDFIASREDVIKQAIDKFLTQERLSVLMAGRLSELLSEQFERFLEHHRSQMG